MATLTLYPNGAGSAQGWDAEGGDYTRIDETSQDGDTTRLYSPTDNAIADFDLADPTTEEGAINSVTVYIHTRGLDPVSNVVQLLVRLSSTNYLSADKTYNNTSYHDESNTWSTNPATSAAWTWAEVAALRAGMKRISGGGQTVTQLRVVVDYTPATYEQEGFRFFNDDGDEDASTGLAAQDTNITQPESVITRLRMLINTTGQTDPRRYILYYKKSTDGTYIKVPTSGTSEAFTIVASSHITASGDPTTARLTAPSGKSTSDFDAGRIQDDENPSDSVTVSADDYTEMEWALQANAAAVDGGVYQFRVYKYLETYGTELTTGGTASALGENGPNETAAKAFDDDAGTKWLHFTGSATWLKYDLGSGVTKLVTKYALTSANDDDTRDPKDWELQGSNDNSAWTTVDTVTGETFASRGLRKEFVCDTPGTTAYRYWRLYINANNGNGSITQLAEVQLYQLSDPVALDTYTVTPEWTIGTPTTTYTVTVTAKARVKKLAVTATATAKARVKGLGVTKTVTAKARVKQLALTQTVTAKARVKQAVTKNITSKARIVIDGAYCIVNETLQNTPTGTLSGSATFDDTNDYVVLTSADNSIYGRLEYSGNLGTDFDVVFDFFAGGGNGADATFFYFGASSLPNSEDDNTGGYVIALDEYDGNTIQLKFAGTDVTSSVSAGVEIDDSTWRTARIEVRGQTFRIYLDDSLKFEYTDSVRTLGGNLFGWGARTGGLNNEHRIREISVCSATATSTFQKYVDSKARVKKQAVTKNITAKARTKVSAVTKTVTSRAMVKKSLSVFVQSMARVKHDAVAVSMYARTRVKYNVSKTFTAKARLIVFGVTRTVQAKADVKKTTERTITARASVNNIGSLRFWKLHRFERQASVFNKLDESNFEDTPTQYE